MSFVGTEDRRDNLRLAAYIHQDADIRDQAGIRLVESFAPEEACKLFELAVDKKFPDKARIAAGLKWVGIHTAAGDYSPLQNQRNITELPSAVREVIKASFETAVLNFAEKTRDAFWTALVPY